MLRCRDSQPADLTAFADHLTQNYTPNTVIIDATASDEPPAHYLDWMRQGIHVITPNKKLNSGMPATQLLIMPSQIARARCTCCSQHSMAQCGLVAWAKVH